MMNFVLSGITKEPDAAQKPLICLPQSAAFCGSYSYIKKSEIRFFLNCFPRKSDVEDITLGYEFYL